LGYLADVMKNLSSLSTAVGAPALGRSTRSARRGLHRLGVKGFTIAEVVMATFVLTFAIGSSLIALQSGFNAIDYARCTTLAGQVLQSQMEKLRLLTWAQLTDTTTGPGANAHHTFSPDNAIGSATQLARFTSYTQTIADAPAPFASTMKDITLTATWAGLDGQSHSLSYVTRYAQNGISDFFYTTH
jgi:hypothetical protein